MNLFNPVQDVVQLLCLVQYARFVGTVFDPSAGCKEAWPLAAGEYDSFGSHAHSEPPGQVRLIDQLR